ncbi:DUF418 domain-containing protein [Spirillospora sp. NPDC029432]|uniref:DUF418 domain-containing protein n=1 Tax=Spirillospora sp. NPDC029432 TaxID=3154599 RepID=UPI00345602FA
MDETTSHRAPAGAPTPEAERSLAPDLARGAALLGIALANSVYYVNAPEYGARSRPVGGSPLDGAADLLLVALVDGRWLPLFAALFGYGAVQMTRRQSASGHDLKAVRRLQRRRFGWLTAFGLAHLLLLFGGDILAIYGILGFGLLLMLRARDRTLLASAGAALVAAVPLAALVGMPPFGTAVRNGIPSLLTGDPWEALVLRAAAWPLDVVLLSLSAFAPMLLGVWAARRGVLDDPNRHRSLLRRTALIGIPAGAAGGVPLGLIAAGLWSAGTWATFLASVLHVLTGFAAALGAGAAFALAAAGRAGRGGPVARALTATGRRSLSCYLAQSVVFVALFAPYAGGLGDDLGTAAMAAAAALTWLATVLAAGLAARTGRRGPAEALLRRLTYRRRTR